MASRTNYTDVQRSFAVTASLANQRSPIIAQRLYRSHFNLPATARVPDRTCLVRWSNQFRDSARMHQPRFREATVRTPENIELVRAEVERDPNCSVRKHACATEISRSSIHRILREDLHLHAYKLCIVQELKESDSFVRRAACIDFQQRLPRDELIFFRDEAHFELSGSVNKQNMRYWSNSNPEELHSRPLNDQRLTVRCALSEEEIIGPFFFEENGITATVTSQRYLAMLQNFFMPALDELGIQDAWFMQDGATPHTARISMDHLRQAFPGRLISKYGDLTWPAWSPDLTPCDFYLWGYLKSIVYRDRPQSLAHLKVNIEEAIRTISPGTLTNVMRIFWDRLDECIAHGGRHLSDTIFKS